MDNATLDIADREQQEDTRRWAALKVSEQTIKSEITVLEGAWGPDPATQGWKPVSVASELHWLVCIGETREAIARKLREYRDTCPLLASYQPEPLREPFANARVHTSKVEPIWIGKATQASGAKPFLKVSVSLFVQPREEPEYLPPLDEMLLAYWAERDAQPEDDDSPAEMTT